MTLEALASNELPTFLIYDTISATPLHHPEASSTPSLLFDEAGGGDGVSSLGLAHSAPAMLGGLAPAGQGRRKRRRRPRSCKNKEEAESQRMTHIAVERNRRRQMNEHLSVLRSLMPESYIQRGDQASIVGGAIDFVKELEQLLQSLEAQKRTLQQQKGKAEKTPRIEPGSSSSNTDDTDSPPFAQFFAYPQYVWCHAPRDYPPPENRSAVADVEVTLIETHANLRILSPRRPGQLLKMVAGLQSLRLTILHLNVTTLDSMVLYSLSTKVDEGCHLTTVDDIAAAVHHMLSLIEAEVSALSQ
ncbi:transcription factor bHLH71-like [Phoenix dactylifera]|uniref:Transcription factor bHLH71-like n=1 Tax=Phoenix dactylifera TaxID=42345 RepID=A0A8B8J734_PHODC|nr:transcription factor bHLH71-like [Phoenix dactylifera]XP_038974933.1 transcription factor bHLH71-like [Phoenix dactylifera]